MTDLYQALERLLDSLESQSIPYALIGGIAVRAHAIPRNTNDIDVMATIPEGRRVDFFQQLFNHGFEVEVPDPYFQGWIAFAGCPSRSCESTSLGTEST